MNILVCNDDGYDALGIKILKKHLEKYGDVYLIGPKNHQSGASHSINIHGPLEFYEFGHNEYYVDSSPADCVRVSKLLNKIFVPHTSLSAIILTKLLCWKITLFNQVDVAW